MTRAYIRHVCLAVGVSATLVPHWVESLRAPGEAPLSFVVGLGVAVTLVMLWAIARNREEHG